MVPGAGFSAERRRAARERLSQALAAVKPRRLRDSERTKSTNEIVAEKENAGEEAKAEESSTSGEIEDETIKNRTSQLGRLSLIAAASGWDTKLRELVMKEANQTEPLPAPSPSSTPPMSPRLLAERRRTVTGLSGSWPKLNKDTKNENEDLTESEGLGRRSVSYSPYSALSGSWPKGLNRGGDEDGGTKRNFTSPRSSMLLSPRCAFEEPMGGVGASTDTLVDGSATSLLSPSSDAYNLYRRATEYSTIATAYDERLREIVLEAAKPGFIGLTTRSRRDTVVGSKDSLEEWRDWKPDASGILSPAIENSRRYSMRGENIARRRTVSLGISRWRSAGGLECEDRVQEAKTEPATPLLRDPPAARRFLNRGRSVSHTIVPSKLRLVNDVEVDEKQEAGPQETSIPEKNLTDGFEPASPIDTPCPSPRPRSSTKPYHSAPDLSISEDVPPTSPKREPARQRRKENTDAEGTIKEKRDRDSAVDIGKDVVPPGVLEGQNTTIQAGDRDTESGSSVDLSDQLYIHYL